MVLTDNELQQAQNQLAKQREAGYAVSALYEAHMTSIVISMNSGIQIAIPVHLLEGLAGASDEALSAIEITPTGLGLHWPELDVDIYIPALLQGVLGSRKWMAAQLGAKGGKARSAIKVAASRLNGQKGGRPRKTA